MLVGIPGSGKSTFAKTMITKYAKHITSDGIRKELWGDESSQQDNNKVFSVMHERTIEALKNGFDVIYDATNINRKDRKYILDKIPAYVAKHCIIVWAPFHECIYRDRQRERTVGKEVIDRILRRFEAPFYDEGFELIRVHIAAEYDDKEYCAKAIKALEIPHDNPHHSVGVAEHCMLCGQNLLFTDAPAVVKSAGYIHDIGKAYTKTFINKKGETTDIAHYYDHQAVGAYMSYGLPGNDITLAWLISSHMAPFINQKYYNSLDPLYKKWITALHEADRAAH